MRMERLHDDAHFTAGSTPLALILGAGLPANAALLVGPVLDPADDLRQFDPDDPSSYAGPPNPGLDVLSANVIFNRVAEHLDVHVHDGRPDFQPGGPDTGANLGTFSWGINHGFGNLNFAAIGLPNVLFDSVLALNPNGTATYRGTQAPAGSVTASGNTLTAVLPVSFLAPPPRPRTPWARSCPSPNGRTTSGRAPCSTPTARRSGSAMPRSPISPRTGRTSSPRPSPSRARSVLGALGAGLALLFWRWKAEQRLRTGRSDFGTSSACKPSPVGDGLLRSGDELERA